MPLGPFKCSECGETRDVRTLRNSVCEDCRELQLSRSAEAAAERTRVNDFYEAIMSTLPVYEGELTAWKPGMPNLLPDRKHFICPGCLNARETVNDLGFLFRKNPLDAIPSETTYCDSCYRSGGDQINEERELRKLFRKKS